VGKTWGYLKGAALALAFAVPGIAIAQTVDVPAPDSGIRRFPPEFFAAYAPITALDMVRRIPGFSIDEGEERRGFGENAGNVLIDGDRPSTKSDNILTILGRIPASQVARIELTEQAGADGETRGVGQTVNIIRKSGAALTGTYEASTLIGTRYGVTPFGEASATLKRGKTSFEVNASLFDEKIQGFGPEDFQNGSRQLIERRSYIGQGRFREAKLGGAIKTRIGKAKINTNAQINWEDGSDFRAGTFANAAGLPTGTERLVTKGPDGDFTYEVGGDVEFPLLPKLTTKLIGLYRTGVDSNDAFIETIRPASPTTLFATTTRNKPSEAVFRIQNDWLVGRAHAVQFGAELAYNRLDARFRGSNTVGSAPPALSSADVLVRETRLEPFVSDVWSLSPKWKIEGGAIFEFSKLRLSGASVAQRSFRFIKPRIAATWTASKATTMEFRAENQVSQLDFEEFATSVDLGQGNQVDTGNRDLVPEKTTTFSALIRQKFLERGSIQLLGSYVLVSDTLDLVPVDAGGGVFFDGAGNIGKSKRWNAELEITLPFDWLTKPLGISGMELKYVGHYHGSRVTDPVTGETRRRSFRVPWHQSWEFRHDLAKAGIAYGFTVKANAASKAYFVSQFRSTRELTNFTVFAEYKKFALGTIRLEGFAVNGDPFIRERLLYQGTRASGIVTDIIDRKRKLDPRILVRLTGKF
jgi:outer membrane receptor protein involved in Fe transport